MYQAVAMLVTFALALWMLNIQNFAQAANLTNISDTLTDSDLGVASDHTIQFTIPALSAGIVGTNDLVVTFPAGFGLGSIVLADVDLTVDGTPQTLVSGAPAINEWELDVTGQVVTLTSGGGSAVAAAGDVLIVEIGTNAGGVNQITNPGVADSYEITVSTPVDSGQTVVAIVDDVLVTANVDTSFDFVVSGFSDPGINVNGTTTTGTSTATALPFGTLTAGDIETLAQRLQVTTNAINGFMVTVFQSDDFRSTTGAIIDSFENGSYLDTPGLWSNPTSNITQNNTWGHWGLTSSDDVNATEFGNNLWVAASTTPREIFHHGGPADGTTDLIGSTTVGYQVEITALQEAADDYQTTLTYVATPTF